MFENDNNYSDINSTITFAANKLQNNNIVYYFVPFYALLFLIGTFGNGLVIVSILRSSRLRTVTNTYLLNIAIADFVLILSIPFLIVTILAKGWIFGNILCKMYYNFIHINQYVSSLLLAALSFDRYLAVCHPIRAINFRTTTKCALIIAGCWLVSGLFLCPTWFFATVTSERHELWHGFRVQKCVIDFPAIISTIPPEILFTYYAFLLGFLCPVSVITTCYILVLARLHRIRRKHRSEIKQRSHRKVTRIVLAVITAYFICWVPYWFLQIFITIDPLIHSLQLNFSILPIRGRVTFLTELTHLTTMIGYANNALNPLLYVFLSESFREEYLTVLKCFPPVNLFLQQENTETNNQRQLQQQELTKSSSKHRQSQPLAKRHSIAIDEMPSDYRPLSSCFSSGRTRLSQTLSISQTGGREITTCERSTITRASFLSRQRHSNGNGNINHSEMLMMKSSTNSAPPLSMIIDDGGVYCGE